MGDIMAKLKDTEITIKNTTQKTRINKLKKIEYLQKKTRQLALKKQRYTIAERAIMNALHLEYKDILKICRSQDYTRREKIRYLFNARYLIDSHFKSDKKLRFTDKDLLTLDFMACFQLCKPDKLCLRVNDKPTTMYRRLRRLEQWGLVYDTDIDGIGTLFGLTEWGNAIMGERIVSWRTAHYKKANRLPTRLVSQYIIGNVLAGNDLLFQDIDPEDVNWMAYDEMENERRKNPDPYIKHRHSPALVVKAHGQLYAVEVLYVSNDSKRLAEIYSQYDLANSFYKILFITNNKRYARSIKEKTAALGINNIDVIPLMDRNDNLFASRNLATI